MEKRNPGPGLLDGVTGEASKLDELKLITLRGHFVDSKRMSPQPMVKFI
jgi:hypothetical protein